VLPEVVRLPAEMSDSGKELPHRQCAAKFGTAGSQMQKFTKF